MRTIRILKSSTKPQFTFTATTKMANTLYIISDVPTGTYIGTRSSKRQYFAAVVLVRPSVDDLMTVEVLAYSGNWNLAMQSAKSLANKHHKGAELYAVTDGRTMKVCDTTVDWEA
jgi:hypothetical protein